MHLAQTIKSWETLIVLVFDSFKLLYVPFKILRLNNFFLLEIPSVTANINASCQFFYFKLVIYIIFYKPLISVILRVSVNFKLVVVHYFQVPHISFIKNIKYSIVSGGQNMIRSKSLALLKSILLFGISNTFLFLYKFLKNLGIT